MSAHRAYAQELRQRLPRHCFDPVPQRLLWILPYVATVVVGITVMARADLALPAKLGLSVLIGLAFCGLEPLGHEIIHGAMVKPLWQRELAGGLCLLPVGIVPMLWRLWHNGQHHAHTQIHGRDPDVHNTLEEYHRRPAVRLLYRLVPTRSLMFFALLSIWSPFHATTQLVRTLRRLDWRGRLGLGTEALIPVVVWGGLGTWLGWDRWVFFYLIPFLISNVVVMAHIATNHFLNQLLDDDDPLAGSLSVTEPKLLHILLSNFSHHTEHHVFPAMSARYLPQVKRLLKELWPDRYHEMPLWKAVRALWLTPHLYLDPVRFIDPHSGETYGALGHGLDPDDVRALDEPAGTR